MAQVSKYPISKEIYDRIFEIFLQTLIRIRDKAEAEEFTGSLLSPVERIMLAKRLAIAFLLEKGYEYRQIQKTLRVSLPTIASVSFVRQYGGEGYKKVIKKIIQEEKLSDLLERAVLKLLEFPAKGTKGSGVWRYLKQEVENERKRSRKAF